MIEKKLFSRLLRVENQRDTVVTRWPGIDEQRSARRLKIFYVLISQKVQRLSQRRPPLLIPSRLATGVTATIANPAPDAMDTTPGCSFPVWPIVDFNLEFGRMFVEILSVVRDGQSARRRFLGERMSQTEIAKLEMMAVSLAVGRDIDHLFAVRGPR